MELKYVGAMPHVSAQGVGFDQSKPDKYTFLNATVELLEALNFAPTETTRHLHSTSGKEYSGKELLALLKKYCPNIEDIFSQRQEKTDAFKSDLIKRVHENKIINEDERNVWLKNIELMTSYYYQYVTNESAYKCALESLGKEIHDARIEEVTFPMFRNYGLVLHDLIHVLENRKPPIDAYLTIEAGREGLLGTLNVKHK